MTEKEVLETINELILEEKGNRVLIKSKLSDSKLDSFGYTVFFIDLDSAYGYFNDVAEGEDPFKTIDWENITIKEIVAKCL